jgi:cell division transport system permease protein
MVSRKRHAATSRVTRGVRFRSWISHHQGCLRESLIRLFRHPLSSVLTMAVLAIALALPGGLYILSQNILSLSTHWDTDAKISLFLNRDVSDEEGLSLSQELMSNPQLERVDFLSRAQALEEFRQMTTFQYALEHIAENPLPAVIIITPSGKLSTDALEKLRNELLANPRVELAQLDLEWIKRLKGIVEIAQRAILIIAGILAIAVILVVGNTIRLEIENRREEIVITKLFGATHAYIRRPFLYDGFWFGLIGGLMASMLIAAALWLLSKPVMNLIALYESNFTPVYPGIVFVVSITLSGGVLGYLGAWSAVTQNLYRIEPE